MQKVKLIIWPNRREENEQDRLKSFKEATRYNAIFICVCCHQRMFESNVQPFTAALRNKINQAKPNHVDACVSAKDDKIRMVIYKDGKRLQAQYSSA